MKHRSRGSSAHSRPSKASTLVSTNLKRQRNSKSRPVLGRWRRRVAGVTSRPDSPAAREPPPAQLAISLSIRPFIDRPTDREIRHASRRPKPTHEVQPCVRFAFSVAACVLTLVVGERDAKGRCDVARNERAQREVDEREDVVGLPRKEYETRLTRPGMCILIEEGPSREL